MKVHKVNNIDSLLELVDTFIMKVDLQMQIFISKSY